MYSERVKRKTVFHNKINEARRGSDVNVNKETSTVP
jgi:hypothetical protein